MVDGAVTVVVDDPQALVTMAASDSAPIGAKRDERRGHIRYTAGVAATAVLPRSKKVPGSCCYHLHLNSRLGLSCHLKN
jgi:hypothetical protein